jgi:hemolysin activation/secretion protein
MYQPPGPLAVLFRAVLIAIPIIFSSGRSFAQETQAVLAKAANTRIQVKKIEVTGSTLFSQQELQSILAEKMISAQPETVALSDLQDVANQITQLYLERGFLTSRAVLQPQLVKEGIVTIAVVEGKLADIQIEGLESLRAGYIRSRLQQRLGTPLNARKLEEKLRLLKSDPLLESVESSLRPGRKPGESILRVKVKEADRWQAALSTNNYSQSSLQPEKSQMTTTYRNITGLGDELSLSSSMPLDSTAFEQESLRNYDIAYRMPVNAMNGALQVQATVDDKTITESAFAALGIRNRSERYSIGFRQPLVRSVRQEFALSLHFKAEKTQSFLFDDIPFAFGSSADDQGITQTRILEFGQDYSRRDSLGVWNLRSSLNFGLDVLEATSQAGATPDGQFFSWQVQGQRVQKLGGGSLLIAQGALQLSPDSLLSSQQFELGGGQSVRGFRQNARLGDNGWRVSLEGRVPLWKTKKDKRPILQLAPFVEAGGVWNVSQNLNGQPQEGFLAGAGVGLLFQPSRKLNIRVDYGVPLVRVSDGDRALQENGLYFSIGSSY